MSPGSKLPSPSDEGVGNPFADEEITAEPENLETPPEIVTKETENDPIAENTEKPEAIVPDQSEHDKSGNPFEEDEQEPGVDNSNKDNETETPEPVAIEPVVGFCWVVASLVAS